VNIIITGFMGSGKSTSIEFLSSFYDCYDLDKIIEEITNSSISEIFNKKGEDFFRKLEQFVFGNLIAFEKIIIATGGGTLQYYNEKENLKKNTKVIFLYSPIDKLWERTRKKERPLAKDFNLFEKLYFERLPTYFKYSDVIIDSNQNGWKEKIISYLKRIGFCKLKNSENTIKINKFLLELKSKGMNYD